MQASTLKQIVTVCESYEDALNLCPELGSRFYAQLLTDHKDIAEYFNSAGMGAQHSRFISMFHIILLKMKDNIPIADSLGPIGSRHASYNLKDEDFEHFGSTLIKVVSDVIPYECDENWYAAWTSVYQDVISTMSASSNSRQRA